MSRTRNINSRFRIALKKTFPLCSRPVIGVLHTLLGQESSSNYSLGDIQLHLAIKAKRRVAAAGPDKHYNETYLNNNARYIQSDQQTYEEVFFNFSPVNNRLVSLSVASRSDREDVVVDKAVGGSDNSPDTVAS